MKSNLKVSYSSASLCIKTRLLYFYYDILRSSIGSAFLSSRRRNRLAGNHSSRLGDLDKLGFTVIPNYLDAEQCNQAVIEVKSLIEEYPSFVHKGEDDRIFGIDQILPVARKLADDSDFRELGELVNREQTYCAFTLAGWLQSSDGGSSGGGWHRDAFFSQYKAMLYLTDVKEENGPFELLPRSHHVNSVMAGIKKAGLGYMQNRLSDSDADRLEEALSSPRKTFTGGAGTLILFNSSAVHRGRPIVRGERLALTNYYFPVSRNLRSVRQQFAPVLTAADIC